MKLASILFALSIVGMANAQGAAAAPPQGGTSAHALPDEKIFDPTRDSAKDIADAVKKATKENKRILLDVGGNWCIWCHRLDNLFKTDKPIGDMLKKKFIVVKVNFSPENENKEVLSKYPKIPGYPHIFVLEKDGTLLHSQDTGLLETGDHHDPEKVMTFLKKWAK